MWFDCILVDIVQQFGEMQSVHVRADGESIPTDRLEDIDHDVTDEQSIDVGPLRVYSGEYKLRTTRIRSKLRNFSATETDFYIQLDHFNVPLKCGYYACVFPKGWRLVEGHIYDPYSAAENPAENRRYREQLFGWDPDTELSFVQVMMKSNRNTFSLGVIAHLKPSTDSEEFIDEERPLSVRFSGHKGHRLEQAYAEASNEVLEEAKALDEPARKMPGVKLGMGGPSVDLMAWGRYLRDRFRKPKQ